MKYMKCIGFAIWGQLAGFVSWLQINDDFPSLMNNVPTHFFQLSVPIYFTSSYSGHVTYPSTMFPVPQPSCPFI
jgi:hypothetical protein